MIVIPGHDLSRSRSGSEKSANILCSPFVGRYGDRSLRHPGFSVMEPVVDFACIVIALQSVLFAKAGRAPRVLLVFS